MQATYKRRAACDKAQRSNGRLRTHDVEASVRLPRQGLVAVLSHQLVVAAARRRHLHHLWRQVRAHHAPHARGAAGQSQRGIPCSRWWQERGRGDRGGGVSVGASVPRPNAAVSLEAVVDELSKEAAAEPRPAAQVHAHPAPARQGGGAGHRFRGL